MTRKTAPASGARQASRPTGAPRPRSPAPTRPFSSSSPSTGTPARPRGIAHPAPLERPVQPAAGPTLVFDLETQRLAHEVGGWANVARLGLSGAVTLEVQTGRVRRYVESDAAELIGELRRAGMVIGCNLLGFDYGVLAPYGLDPLELAAPGRTLDLLDSLHRAAAVHVSLDNAAAATLGVHKSADGLAAVAWYRQGLIEKVLDYCEQDARVTHRLWEYGRSHGMVRIRDTAFRLREVRVSW